MELTLNDIGAVLGCSKAVASRLRSGKYERPGSKLLAQFLHVRVQSRYELLLHQFGQRVAML